MEHETTIEDLNSFFADISYDYYNLHMAVIISYYNHKFIPLSQKEIYADIISKKDFRAKLRKSNGKKYSSIKMRIKDILKKKKSIFKNENKTRKRGVKYSINLNLVIPFWKWQVSIMNKDKKNNKDKNYDEKYEEEDSDFSLKNENSKKFEENEENEENKSAENDKNEKDEKDGKDKKDKKDEKLAPAKKEGKRKVRRYLTRKTRRKEFKNENENENENETENRKDTNNSKNNKNADYIIDLSSSKNARKTRRGRRRTRRKNGYLTDDLKKKKNNKKFDLDTSEDEDDALKDVFTFSIYDKLPKFDEKSLSEIIDQYEKLIEKLNDIREKLLKLQNSKLAVESLEEDKLKSKKEKNSIINHYKIWKNLIKKKTVNTDVIERQKDLLKKGIDSYLELYGDSAENLFKILCERNELFDYLIFEREKEISENANECFLNLKNFINSNKTQINEANNFLKNYPRSYYKKNFEKILKEIENEAIEPIKDKLEISDIIKDNAKKENEKEKKTERKAEKANENEKEIVKKPNKRGRKPKKYHSAKKQVNKEKEKEKEKENEEINNKQEEEKKEKIKLPKLFNTSKKNNVNVNNKNIFYIHNSADKINNKNNINMKINNDNINNNLSIDNNIQNVNNKMECENSNTSSNDSTIINNNKNVSNNNTLIHPQMGYDLEQLKMNFYKDLQMNYDDNDNNDVLPDKNNKIKSNEKKNQVTPFEEDENDSANMSKKSRTTATFGNNFVDNPGQNGYKIL